MKDFVVIFFLSCHFLLNFCYFKVSIKFNIGHPLTGAAENVVEPDSCTGRGHVNELSREKVLDSDQTTRVQSSAVVAVGSKKQDEEPSKLSLLQFSYVSL